MLSSALIKGRDSTFLLLRLSDYYCGRGPLAAQLDRSASLVSKQSAFFACQMRYHSNTVDFVWSFSNRDFLDFVMTTDEYEMFLLALGVEEQADIDYLSFVFLPTFSPPFYASITLSTPCRIKLHVPLDQCYDKDDLCDFEHYWKAEKVLSSGFSAHTIRDYYQLNPKDFADFVNYNTRDGFAAYCRGVYQGDPYSFFTHNPDSYEQVTHYQYLMIIRKVLLKLFPNVICLQHLKGRL